MPTAKIIVYATEWCGDCRRAMRFFDQNHIEYNYVNIDVDKQGEQFVKATNKGLRSVPTIVFEDGSILVEPSTRALADKLGLELQSPLY